MKKLIFALILCLPLAAQAQNTFAATNLANTFTALQTYSAGIATTTLSASGVVTSTVTTGTAPLVVASTTNIPNLNASSLNGATFAAPGAIGGTTAAAGTFTALAATSIALGHCASSASPAVCGANNQGFVNIAAAATTVVVNDSSVTATSDISLTFDESLGAALSVTCNPAGASESATYFISARTVGVSFTIKTNTAPTTNPACISYSITN